ncbi:NAD-dependent epimerase/dehydratase [Neobacillus bataviensis LMG 21833]|uniref:NAD-dependent epimerase/dehydratase n=1 Tax=Neobacillus bataviensis LMG 21833 TaxID=1117379 RepID=K6DFK6_9BACI|nr:NAD(P)-dependent oxidoreductase [Neobacillus bataviensis]EKN71337.1 NAD-dependent epimerase/dehydratase [Neobacillus bataviensis LMG 21833]
MKNILIIGASGFIGKHLLPVLYNLGHNITTIDRSKNHYDGLLDNVNFNYGNLQDLDLGEFLCEKDIVILLAGKSGALDSYTNYKNDLDNNSLLVLTLLDAIRKLDKKPTVIFPSSRLVYGKQQNGCVSEDGDIFPMSPYAIHKLSCEHYLKAYHNMYDINYINFRISIPYGYDNVFRNGFGIVNSFIKKAFDNEEIKLFGDGSQLRDIIYIGDLVEILIRTIDNVEEVWNETYNLGGTEVLSLYEIASKVVKLIGSGKITFQPWPKEYSLIETGDLFLDSQKIYKKINYIPQFTLEEVCYKLLMEKSSEMDGINNVYK